MVPFKTIKKLLSVLLLAFSLCAASQDSSTRINKQWSNLKKQITRRTDIVNNLSKIIQSSKSIDQDLINATRERSRDVFYYVDTTNSFDSITVITTCIKNKNLTMALAKTMAAMENDSKLRQRQEVVDLLLQLQFIEQRIKADVINYNDACRLDGKSFLLYVCR